MLLVHTETNWNYKEKKIKCSPELQRKSEVMAEDTSRRSTLEPAVMAPLHKSVEQQLAALKHAALV